MLPQVVIDIILLNYFTHWEHVFLLIKIIVECNYLFLASVTYWSVTLYMQADTSHMKLDIKLCGFVLKIGYESILSCVDFLFNDLHYNLDIDFSI